MRHLLSAADLDRTQTIEILDLAEEMSLVQERPVKKLPALRGRTVLTEVGAQNVPVIDVFNKCDRLTEGERARLESMNPGALCVSALTGEGAEELREEISARIPRPRRRKSRRRSRLPRSRSRRPCGAGGVASP